MLRLCLHFPPSIIFDCRLYKILDYLGARLFVKADASSNCSIMSSPASFASDSPELPAEVRRKLMNHLLNYILTSHFVILQTSCVLLNSGCGSRPAINQNSSRLLTGTVIHSSIPPSPYPFTAAALSYRSLFSLPCRGILAADVARRYTHEGHEKRDGDRYFTRR